MSDSRFLYPLDEHIQENYEIVIKQNLKDSKLDTNSQLGALLMDLEKISGEDAFRGKGITIQEKISEESYKLLSDFLQPLKAQNSVVMGAAGAVQNSNGKLNVYLHIPTALYLNRFPLKTAIQALIALSQQKPSIYQAGAAGLASKNSAAQFSVDARHATQRKFK